MAPVFNYIRFKSICRYRTTAFICASDILKIGCQTTNIRYLKIHQKDISNTGSSRFMSPKYLLIRRYLAKGFCFKSSIYKFIRLGTYFRAWNKNKINTYWGICDTRVTLLLFFVNYKKKKTKLLYMMIKW